MLQVAIDESEAQGLSKEKQIFVMGGYASTKSRWDAFSKDWANEVNSYKLNETFSMKFANHEWYGDEFVDRVNKLQSIISNNVEFGFRVNCHPGMIANYMRDAPDQRLRKPHYFCMVYLINFLFSASNKRTVGRDVSFIFDRGRTSINVIAEQWKRMREEAIPEIRDRMNHPPLVLASSEYLPLQAADMTVWWERRQIQERIDENTNPRHRKIDSLDIPYFRHNISEEWLDRFANLAIYQSPVPYAENGMYGFLHPDGSFSGVVSANRR